MVGIGVNEVHSRLAGHEKAGTFGEVDARELVDHCSRRVCSPSPDVATSYSVDMVKPVDDEKNLLTRVLTTAVVQSLGERVGGGSESGADTRYGVRSLEFELVKEATDDDFD